MTAPTPEPTPAPTPEKTPEPTPAPTPEKTPEPTPEPTPQDIKKPSITISASPSELLEGGSVTVNISIFNPNSFKIENISISIDGKKVKSIVGLKGGDTYTYTGKYSVNTNQIDKNIRVTVSYDGGSAASSFKISRKDANITVNTISKVDKPSLAAGGQANFTFSIENKSDVAIEDAVLKASTLNDGKPLSEEFTLEPGKATIIAYTQEITETIDVAPVLTYTAAGKSYSKDLEKLTVTVNDAEMAITAAISDTADGKVTFTLNLENTGNVDFTNVALYDATDARITTSSNKLTAGESLSAEHTMTFTESTSVDFYALASDADGTSYTFRSNTLEINAEDSAAAGLSDLLTLTAEANEDSFVLKKPGTANISLTLKNAHTEAFTDVKITETNSGEIVESYSIFPTGEKVLTYSADIEETTSFTFALTATDPEGNPIEYTIPAINVTVESKNGGSNKLMTLIIILAIVIVLIIGCGVALIVLVSKEKKKKQSAESMRTAAVSDARRRNRTASAATHRRPAADTNTAEAPVTERRRPAPQAVRKPEAPQANTESPRPRPRTQAAPEAPVRKSYEHLKAEPTDEPIIVPPVFDAFDPTEDDEPIVPEETTVPEPEPETDASEPKEPVIEEPEEEIPELQPLPKRKHRSFEDRNMF